MIIGRTKGRDISLPCFTRINKIDAAPRETRTTQFNQHKVGCQPCMTAIAIWKWVDEYQAVMKTRSDFIRLIGVMFDPVLAIIQRLAQINWNTIRIDTNIAVCTTKLSGPAPDTAKHPIVQIHQETLIKHIALA